MLGLDLIPRPLHATTDYLWSSAFAAAPEVFGFANDKPAALFCRLMGGSSIGVSLLTRYELGLVKVIPFNVHLLGWDVSSVVLGLLGPWLLGFAKNPKARSVVLGFILFEIGAILLSKPDPQ